MQLLIERKKVYISCQLANILNHALQLDDVDYIDEDEYARIAQRVVPQAGDVLISCTGSIGDVCRV